jgi:hypothetical protein
MLSKPFRKTNAKMGRVSALAGTAEFPSWIELKLSRGCGRRNRIGTIEDMYGDERLHASPTDH